MAPAAAKSGNDAIDRLDHEMHVDRRRDAVLAQRFADERADREIRDVVIVHDVEVDEVRAGRNDGVDFLAEPREVGRQDRRGYPAVTHKLRLRNARSSSRFAERVRGGSSLYPATPHSAPTPARTRRRRPAALAGNPADASLADPTTPPIMAAPTSWPDADAERQQALARAATLVAGLLQRDVAQRRAEQRRHAEADQGAGQVEVRPVERQQREQQQVPRP